MNNISILTGADFSAAYDIEKASHAFPWKESIFFSNQGKNYLNLKLSYNGEIAGFAITQIALDEATLMNVAIHPDWQRCGFARRLLHALMQELKKRSVVTMWLEVRVSNIAAIKLYNLLGFIKVSVRRNYYTRDKSRESAIIMATPIALNDL